MSVSVPIARPSGPLGSAARPLDRGWETGRPAPNAWIPGHATRSRIKGGLDRLGAGLALVLLAPVLAVVAALIRLESRGPILFRQARTGLGGTEFVCWKFRTMVADAEERLAALESRNEAAGGVLFKMRQDPRITPLGRVLRRTSLDELPQLWNVVRGEMSLVGPRPLQRRDSELLAQLDPEGFWHRLAVRPGLTGAWQVGGRSEVDSQGMVALDRDYVDHWTLGRDLSILLRTIRVVLTGHGAR